MRGHRGDRGAQKECPSAIEAHHPTLQLGEPPTFCIVAESSQRNHVEEGGSKPVYLSNFRLRYSRETIRQHLSASERTRGVRAISGRN